MLQGLARLILRAGGWTLVGEVPAIDKAVVIAAPHTSNWDGFWMIVCKIALNFRLRFFAKHTLFWWPLGPLLRSLGAIPIERGKGGANVDKLVQLFASSDQLFLALAPEGTRRWKPYWKSGFYRIAEAAKVPLVLAFIDYRDKRAGIGPQIELRATVEETLAEIRAFYATCTAAIPANVGPIALPPSSV